jgi:hypothetical protein
MRAVKYMDEEILVKKAVKALIGELGPIEANRFISMPRKKRIESVKRHREWQKQLDKNEFFNENRCSAGFGQFHEPAPLQYQL